MDGDSTACRWLLSPVKFVATATLTVTVTLPVRLAVTVTACRGRGPIPGLAQGLALAQRCQRMCQG